MWHGTRDARREARDATRDTGHGTLDLICIVMVTGTTPCAVSAWRSYPRPRPVKANPYGAPCGRPVTGAADAGF
jgi:hypothetical protein